MVSATSFSDVSIYDFTVSDLVPGMAVFGVFVGWSATLVLTEISQQLFDMCQEISYKHSSSVEDTTALSDSLTFPVGNGLP